MAFLMQHNYYMAMMLIYTLKKEIENQITKRAESIGYYI